MKTIPACLLNRFFLSVITFPRPYAGSPVFHFVLPHHPVLRCVKIYKILRIDTVTSLLTVVFHLLNSRWSEDCTCFFRYIVRYIFFYLSLSLISIYVSLLYFFCTSFVLPFVLYKIQYLVHVPRFFDDTKSIKPSCFNSFLARINAFSLMPMRPLRLTLVRENHSSQTHLLLIASNV